MQFVPQSQVHRNRLMVAGLAAVGASLIVSNPMTPTADLQSNVAHRAVKLVNTEELDWTTVLADTQANLQLLETGASNASSELSTALTNLGDTFGGQVTNAISGFGTGIENSIDGGWYASDDGYVFGLFGGTLTGADGTESGSIIGEVSTALQAGDTVQAFSYLDTWGLETLDHTLKPLLEPLLDITSGRADPVTTFSIPVELTQIQSNLLETFASYNELKSASDALLAPGLGFAFGLSSDFDNIASDLGSGNSTQALADINNLLPDLTQDVLNGYSAGSEPFPGLLDFATTGDAGLLQDLLVTWPTQLADALTVTTSTAAAESLSSAALDIFGGL